MLKTFSPPEKVIRSGSLYEAAVEKINDKIEKNKSHGSIVLASQLLAVKRESESRNTKIGFKKDPMQQQSLKSYFTKVEDPIKEEKLVESAGECSEELNMEANSTSTASNCDISCDDENLSVKNKLVEVDLFGSESVSEKISTKRKLSDSSSFGSDAIAKEMNNSESIDRRKNVVIEDLAPDIRAKRRRVSHLTPKPAPSIPAKYLERISKCFNSSDAEDSTDDNVSDSFQTSRKKDTEENVEMLNPSQLEKLAPDSPPIAKTVEFVSRLSNSFTKRIENLFDDREIEADCPMLEKAEKSSRKSSTNNHLQKAAPSRSGAKHKEYDPTENCSKEKRKYLGMSRSYRSGVSCSNAVNSSSVSKSKTGTKQMCDNSSEIDCEKKTKEAKFAVSDYVKKFLNPHYKKEIMNKELFKFTARNIVHKAVQKLDIACKFDHEFITNDVPR